MERCRVTATASAKPAIVFDLDGTLIDSAPDIQAAANRLLADLGYPAFDLSTITSFIGNGIPMLVRRCLDKAGAPFGDAQLEKAIESFKAFYAEEPAVRTRPYHGVSESLAALSGGGHRLGVCTNKSEDLSKAALEDLGILRHFQTVIGGDTLSTRKPDPAGLHEAIRRLSADAGTAIYVGDSEVDAETASNAGVRFALFTGGYRKSPVSALNHWIAFDDMRDLLTLAGLR
jgi:phosphoglycolate phosphatase